MNHLMQMDGHSNSERKFLVAAFINFLNHGSEKSISRVVGVDPTLVERKVSYVEFLCSPFHKGTDTEPPQSLVMKVTRMTIWGDEIKIEFPTNGFKDSMGKWVDDPKIAEFEFYWENGFHRCTINDNFIKLDVKETNEEWILQWIRKTLTDGQLVNQKRYNYFYDESIDQSIGEVCPS